MPLKAKAWFVYANDGEHRGYVVHAETRGKAKAKTRGNFAFDDWDWIGIKAERFPKLDDVPVTIQNLIDAGIDMTFEGEPIMDIDLKCDCEFCQDGGTYAP